MTDKCYRQTYFVTGHHEMAKPMIALLSDRLVDEGWRVVLSTITSVHAYAKAGKRTLLSTVAAQFSGGSALTYLHQGKYITLNKYLALEQALSKANAVLEQTVLTHEHKYMLEGTAQRISFLASDSGVYLSASCTLATHAMLSEYYALSEEPSTLYSAIDEDGSLWELTETEGEDDYD